MPLFLLTALSKCHLSAFIYAKYIIDIACKLYHSVPQKTEGLMFIKQYIDI